MYIITYNHDENGIRLARQLFKRQISIRQLPTVHFDNELLI